MSNLSDFMSGGGGKPKLITVYTSGTGTYVPTADNARCFVRITAGGASGGGGTGNQDGGPAGATIDFWIRIPIAGYAYSVGAGGVGVANTVPQAGSKSSLGHLVAIGARSGAQAISVTPVATQSSGGSGIIGGIGGTGVKAGGIPGFAATLSGADADVYSGAAAGAVGSGGGSSLYGIGGAGVGAGVDGNNAPSTSYGAGGGGGATTSGRKGGNGASGCIEIWDYGA